MRRKARSKGTDPKGGPSPHRFSHEAMTTLFEVIVPEEKADIGRGLAQELFLEVDHLEGLLSRFDPGSDIAQINRLQPGESILISHATLECLLLGFWLHEETGGAFDMSVGHLMDRWRHEENEARLDDVLYREPAFQDIEEALRHTGFQRLLVDPEEHRVALSKKPGPRLEIDLGGLGKGYALDRLADLLEGWELQDVLLHAGTSTALALGNASLETPWTVGIGGPWGEKSGIDRLCLRDRAASGSGTEVKGEHVLDPRTGYPSGTHLAAWSTAPSAGVADGLSTAFMVMNLAQVKAFCEKRPEIGALLVNGQGEVVDLLASADKEAILKDTESD